MVVTPRILAQIGPAVSSGNSFLIYGQPGNGKTFLAEALGNVDDSCVYIPHAIESQGSIIQVFDPVYHQPVQRRTRAIGLGSEAASLRSTLDQVPASVHRDRWRIDASNAGSELYATSKVYDAPTS